MDENGENWLDSIEREFRYFKITDPIDKKDALTIYGGKGRVGLVMRALAFHQYGPGSISALGVKCGLSLLVLYSAMRSFSPGTPVFPSHQRS